MNKFLLAVAVSGLLYGGASQAQDARPNFLPQDVLDLSAILPPAPANDSPVTKAEIAEIHRTQTEASAAEKSQAKADVEEDAYVFANVLGPNFSADKLPVAAPFLALVEKAESEFVNPAKKIFGRPRPPLLDTTITPCDKLPASGSYPSGHATTGYLMAVVLSQIVPEKRDAIFARAAEFAHNRVLCGVHYPSDIEAGKIRGTVIAAFLMDSPAFKTAFAPAKSEVRKVLGLPAQ